MCAHTPCKADYKVCNEGRRVAAGSNLSSAGCGVQVPSLYPLLQFSSAPPLSLGTLHIGAPQIKDGKNQPRIALEGALNRPHFSMSMYGREGTGASHGAPLNLAGCSSLIH